MVTVKLSNLEDLTGLYERHLKFVVRQSTNDAIQLSTRTASGVSRGGSVKSGYVPVDTGALRASLVSTLSGSTTITQGGGDFNLVIGSMGVGDVATFAFTADYAKAIHYGINGRAGWHFVTVAANSWEAIVRKNIAKARASLT